MTFQSEFHKLFENAEINKVFLAVALMCQQFGKLSAQIHPSCDDVFRSRMNYIAIVRMCPFSWPN